MKTSAAVLALTLAVSAAPAAGLEGRRVKVLKIAGPAWTGPFLPVAKIPQNASVAVLRVHRYRFPEEPHE
jgi:hypothetical protein